MTPLDKLHDLLSSGWHNSADLCRDFGWQPHSLRGRISNVSVIYNVKIERRRIDGVTSYRIASPE